MSVFDLEFMSPLFEILESTKGVPQNPEHHPEGDVFTHSLQVMNIAFRESHDTDLILAAMLHDVGKVKGGYGHEYAATDLLSEYVSGKTIWLIENHMRVWHFILGDMKKYSKCQELIEHPWITHLIQLARWDKMGRNPNVRILYDKSNIMERLNQKIPKHFKPEIKEEEATDATEKTERPVRNAFTFVDT